MYIAELKKAGLSDREAAVYVALLTLGESSVQVIARRAKVARGTTYLVLESLRQRGLVSVVIRQRRRFFVAEKPEHLVTMLEGQKLALQRKVTDLQTFIPTLHALMRSANRGSVVRYYDGREGLLAMRQEMVMYSYPHDIWYNLAPVDDLRQVFGLEGIVCTARVKKGITSRTICLSRSQALQKELLLRARRERVERCFIPQNSESGCGLTIFRDRVAVGYFTRPLGGVIIESQPLASLLTQFFNIAWTHCHGSGGPSRDHQA